MDLISYLVKINRVRDWGTLVLIMWLIFVMQNSESRIDKRIVQSTYKRKYQKCFGIDHIFFTKKIV